MAVHNLFQLLKQAAESPTDKALIIHHSSITDKTCTKISYTQLYEQVISKAERLAATGALSTNLVILLHVNDHLDGISWFWAIVTAGGIPCMSTQFSKDPEHRARHIRSLQKVLTRPLIITTEALVPEFSGCEGLRILTTTAIDNILVSKVDPVDSIQHSLPGLSKQSGDLAALMLTSGSTGDSKAVSLSHGQLLSSIDGKIKIHGTTSHDTFLSWTGIDHVANLVEIHLHSLRLQANQIHIPPVSAVEDPVRLLQKLSDHRVSYTFAPNFLLAKISRALESLTNPESLSLDLSHLRALISGGESNTLDTAVKLTALLQKYGAPKSLIRPGLGLTETCAGAVYSTDCPSYDVSQNLDHCSVGYPTDAVQIRVVRKDGAAAAPNEMGSLQLSGPCVFKGYYNDPEKTATSFTPDEWFKTGDLALIDSNGKLLLTGREKDSVIINGINYSSQAIEHVIEATQIPGVTPSYVVAFPHRRQGHDTEVLCIVYLPTYDPADYTTRSATEVAISRSVIRYCGVRPYEIIPLEASCLPKSSLGKFSRQNIRNEYEKGSYFAYTITEVKSRQLQNASHGKAVTSTEQTIIDVSLQLFPNTSVEIGRNSDIFTLGFSSIDILQLQSSLQKALNIKDISHTTIFAHPIIHELAAALDKLKHNYTFSPVVVLQPHGDNTPLWLIHSGLGEILIFMNLARYITDRPVYALRARGFDGEPHFTSFDDLVTTYHSAIKNTQPEGPYAMAGYAFGGIPAFEIAKRMQARGDEVKFLGLFDQQPFSKDRVRLYDWYRVVLLIASFIGLIKEDYAISYLPEARKLSHEELLDHIMSLASKFRLQELGMDKEKLDNWAQIAFFMKKVMWDYDPEGMVKCMDVFYTVPMKGFGPATNVDDWFNNYISKWDFFVEGGAKYHLVGGSHRTMISPPNVDAFQNLFRKVIEERGL